MNRATPRQIDADVARCFCERKAGRFGNTTVSSYAVFLHGNRIAKWLNDKIWICDGNHPSGTTRARLKQIVYQAGYDFEIRMVNGYIVAEACGQRITIEEWISLDQINEELAKIIVDRVWPPKKEKTIDRNPRS